MENNKSTDTFIKQPVENTIEAFNTDARQGLSSTEAHNRLEKFGYNEIEEREEPLWHRIFRRFWGPIPWMIEMAAILSAIVQKWDDFAIITIMLLVNASLDFLQEHRALNALKALKKRMASEVIVLRDGQFKTIPTRELVPGDVIKLRIGNVIPADVQLLQGEYLLIDQSALTGESLPVSKKVNDVAYASTIVKQGEMVAVVVNTGSHTNFHTVVALVAKASLEERSHFQKMVIRIGNFLILITISLVVFDRDGGLVPSREFPGDSPLRVGVDRCLDTGGTAGSVVGYPGGGCDESGPVSGHCQQTDRHRGAGRCGCILLRQDGYPHKERDASG